MSRYLVVGLAVSFGLALTACDASVDVGVGTECASDADCDDGSAIGGFFCDADGACSELVATVDGADCLDDTDCPDGDACDVDAGLCYDDSVTVVADGGDGGGGVVLGGDCTDDSECDTGDACDDTGVCVADDLTAGSEDAGADCFEDGDCSSGDCDDTTDTCN